MAAFWVDVVRGAWPSVLWSLIVGDASLLQVLRDVVVIFASIVGMCVGVRGLRTWQRQLAGATKHDVARQTLKTLTRLHDAMNDVLLVIRERATFSRMVENRTANVFSPVLTDPDSLLKPRMLRVTREHDALADEADEVMYLFEGEAKGKLDEVFQVFAKFELGYAIESQGDPVNRFTCRSTVNVFYSTDEADRFDHERSKAFSEALDYFRAQLAGR